MRILFVISQLPYPCDTGAKIRSFNLIKNLSAKHNITLVSYAGSEGEKDKINELEKFCAKIEVVSKKEINPLFLAFKNLFSIYPYSVDKYYSSALADRMSSMIEKESFDIVHCDSLQMARNVLRLSGIPKALTEHNIESQILGRVAANETNIFKKLFFYLQYIKLRRYEVSACRKFERVITVSEEDKRFLAQFIDENKISVVPNGVDCEYFSLSTIGHRLSTAGYSLVFTGSMDWQPNDDAMVYFIKSIFPLVKEKEKSVSLTIVGRNPSKRLCREASKDSAIKLVGRVDDVRPYIEKAPVFVVPLRIGGGTRLKILEALSMEKAVVSTSIGCEGLKVSDGKDILIADREDDFASKVLKLFKDESMRIRLGTSGRDLVKELYDYKIVSSALDSAWEKAVSRSGVPILLYHDICTDDFDIKKANPTERPYILNESEFESQMKFLYENGYKTLTLDELLNHKADIQNDKTLIISFDDGLSSNCEKALPILKKYGFKAVFFLTAGKMGKSGMMSWSQASELLCAGMEIGSHSLTHRPPSGLKKEELEYELKRSREVLEENLKNKINYFSSPTGFYNPELPQIAKTLGYKAVLVSKSLLNKERGSFILNKTSIKRDYDFKKFVSIVNKDDRVFKDLYIRQRIRNSLKKALGADIYNLLRGLALKGAR